MKTQNLDPKLLEELHINLSDFRQKTLNAVEESTSIVKKLQADEALAGGQGDAIRAAAQALIDKIAEVPVKIQANKKAIDNKLDQILVLAKDTNGIGETASAAASQTVLKR